MEEAHPHQAVAPMDKQTRNPVPMFKKIVLFITCVVTVQVFAQDPGMSDKEQIREVINLFFQSLETRDTLLALESTDSNAQIWRRFDNGEMLKVDFRHWKEDIESMHTWPAVKEIGLDFDITERNGIASAWVPYEFYRENEFSHCGIDVFTLFKIEGKWKIMCAAYTVEREGCEQYKK